MSDDEAASDVVTADTTLLSRRAPARGRGRRAAMLAAGGVLIAGGMGAFVLRGSEPGHAAMGAPPPPTVTVSAPLKRDMSERMGFLGQFSAVDQVDIRAQVGGILTEIHFQDGQIVHQGDLLFVIDPRPYQIRLEAATAQYQTAQARLALAASELWRAQQLKKTDFGTAQNVDQKAAEQRSAQAAVEQAQSAIHDAQLDLEYCRVTAPFTGRISAHRVSIGNLISGSRAGTSATTLLTTLVSLDPIHLDFDMSENDFLTFQRIRAQAASNRGDAALANEVELRLGDESQYGRRGTLDFVDNALDRSSGTIHARATVKNPDLFLVPGEFSRVRLVVAAPHPALLVPAAAIVPDQSQHLLMTVAADGTVVPKLVETGGLRGGLRVVRSGIQPGDRVIIDGLMHAMPGTKVTAQAGTIHFDDTADGQD